MENKHEHLPEQLFSWAEKYTFEALTPEQQTEVLQYCSIDDYNALHRATAFVTQTEEEQRQHPRSRAILMKHMDGAAYGQDKIVALMQYPLPLWKAAAAVLILLAAGLTAYTWPRKNDVAVSLNNIRDTVFVAVNSEPAIVRVIDTLYREISHKETGRTVMRHAVPAGQTIKPLYASTDMHVLRVEDAGKEQNAVKGRSIRDDSLVQRFRFVTF